MTSRIDGDQLDQSWRATTLGSPFFTIDVGPLMTADSVALIAEFIDVSDPLAEGCLERAAGNPLFLEQLLRAAKEGSVEKLPDSVQSLVIARVDRLSARDKRALQAASVVGQRFTAELVRHLVHDDQYRCDELVAHSLIRAEGDGYLFSHALIQEGVYSSILKRERAKLHEAAAHWFSERDLVLRAEHLDRAGNPAPPKRICSPPGARQTPTASTAPCVSAERGHGVASEPRMRHELACLKGELLHDTGESEASIAAYTAALDEAPDEVSRCEALVGVAAGMRLTTDYAGAMRSSGRGRAHRKERHGFQCCLLGCITLRGNVCFSLGQIERCREEHLLALESARRTGAGDLEARALGGLGDAAYAAGKMRTAFEHYTACLRSLPGPGLRAHRDRLSGDGAVLADVFVPVRRCDERGHRRRGGRKKGATRQGGDECARSHLSHRVYPPVMSTRSWGAQTRVSTSRTGWAPRHGHRCSCYGAV